MRHFLTYILAFLIVLTLSACKKDASIIGVWEAPMQISILGTQTERETADGMTRFTFREDGTVIWETDMPEGKYPDTAQEFRYTLEGGTLTLISDDENSRVFQAEISQSQLKLEGRTDFLLTRVP